jgi:choline monooxygenase
MSINTPSADFLPRTPVHIETTENQSAVSTLLTLPDLSPEILAVEPLPRAYTIPSRWYTDPRYHEADQQVLFARTWQNVGHVEQFKQPGDAIYTHVAGNPIVVVYDPEASQRFRAFYNVCLHRAGPLAVKGEGRKVFQCQYHGWTYFLNGMLRGVPDWDRVELFNKEDYGLRSVHLDIWQGLIFVNLDENPIPLQSVFAGIEERIAPMRLDTKHFYRRDEYEIACNWKVYMDNYLEGYHIPIVHPDLNRVLDYRQYIIETAEYYSLQTSPFQSDANVYTALGGVGNQAFYYTVFPNFMLNILPGRVQTNIVIPVAPDRCKVIFDYFYDEAVLANEDAIQEEIRYSDMIQQEDVEICEQVQRGLQSRVYVQGRFSVKREAGVYHFQSLLKRFYREQLYDLQPV